MASAAGERILLVEDNPTSQELLQQMMECLDCPADFACNGREAVDMALRNDYRLILMDIQMPVMNGLEATCQIRGSGLSRQPQIVAMTANAFDDDKKRCLDVGMNGMLIKPFRLEELQSVLERYLAG
ncbi:hypothetical protein CEK28_04655 [Xenophilus sp. AP218F]|nr:response regulator [Chromobacterium sp. ASV5]OWY40030.1 hypothetical protein CEK28_04655 [Xenophilus sp. AP218F]